MNVDFNEQESERYHDLISKAQDSLEDEDVGTPEYDRKLNNLKTLQTMKTMTDNASINERKVETMGEKIVGIGLKVAGVLAPVFVTGLMIWWDRKDDGGHIMTQYINPALRSGDGAKK